MKKQCSRLKNVEKRSQIIKSEGKKCFFFETVKMCGTFEHDPFVLVPS